MKSWAAISGLDVPSLASLTGLSLLRREFYRRPELALADALARRGKLALGATGKGLGAHRGEHVVRRPQLGPRVHPPLLAAQPLAVYR